MPIYVKQGRAVLYVHVPKTGGTAIQAFFDRNGFRAELLDTGGPKSLNRYRRCAPQHMHAAQIMATLRPAVFDFVFMTVRHPLARILSEYKMRLRGTGDTPSLAVWLDQMFKQYVENPYVAENHIRPQCEFLLPNCQVFRQEDGHGDAIVQRIEQKLQCLLEHRAIGTYNDDAKTSIDPAEIEQITPLVRQFYHQDYTSFGY